jgi:hypothetical protein
MYTQRAGLSLVATAKDKLHGPPLCWVACGGVLRCPPNGADRRWRGVTIEDEEAVTSDGGEAARVRQSRAHLGWKLCVVR